MPRQRWPVPFSERERSYADSLYETEMCIREEGIFDFVYDEERDLFRYNYLCNLGRSAQRLGIARVHRVTRRGRVTGPGVTGPFQINSLRSEANHVARVPCTSRSGSTSGRVLPNGLARRG